MTALAITSSLGATAIKATFDGLPLALSRWAKSRSGPGTRVTASAATYNAPADLPPPTPDVTFSYPSALPSPSARPRAVSPQPPVTTSNHR